MRVLSGVDLLFMQSCYVASDIYEGDYSQKDLAYIANNDGGWPGLMELTGDQIYTLVETTLSMTGNRGAVCNDSTLYVSSGFEENAPMQKRKQKTKYLLPVTLAVILVVSLVFGVFLMQLK